MKRNIKSLIGYTMGATDGVIGDVKEFYFDDDTWTIRYLIVDTGNWLSGRVVLISPEAIVTFDWENKVFWTNLTKEQLKNSPDINTEMVVSRQEEIKLQNYYPWARYWDGGISALDTDAVATSHGPIAMGLPITNLTEIETDQERNAYKHLRSTKVVTGYQISGYDGEIGAVDDFIVDDNSWKMHYLLIGIGHWFSGRSVLLSLDLIKEINWETSSVIVKTTVVHVKNSPEYDPDQELTTAYTLALQDHYNSIP